MKAAKYDFSGWATRNDLLCSDGRTIRKDAFKHNDGETVSLVWNHQHNGPDNVIGHAMLENRNEGVYAYCTLNDTDGGRTAKELIKHGDIQALSIYANQLKQNGNNVVHGCIREVSLVIAGANPGAFIDSVLIHGEASDEEAIIYNDEDEILIHSEEKENETMYDDQTLQHADGAPETNKKDEPKDTAKKQEGSEETIEDVFNTLTDKQKDAVYAIIGAATQNSEGGEENMKHNVFDNDDTQQEDVLMHSAMEAIISDGKRCGSLKESYLQHADEYGITNIDWLFPDYQNVNGNTPGFLKRNPDAWVSVVMNGVHHTPFARIKMLFADLREDDARAKGYAVKAKLKKEEVFGLVKRTVDPTTIYKKQKLDRDDIIDITDFDVVSWLKGEMRMMLDEEIARAILFGDGRSASSDDKIKETSIIPIVSDAALYTIAQEMSSYTAKTFIEACVKGQNDYEGSGNTTLFVANSKVTDMLLIEDTNQHRLYKDVNELALACSVNKICKVPDSIVPSGVYGVIVDLSDYNVGADKGGSVNMFDDFDIDYNQQKYLIETRCSGALTKPFSAVVVKAAASEG